MELADEGSPFARDIQMTALAQTFMGFHDQTLYVIGAGVMGLMHVAVASAQFARVIVSDFNESRLAIARELGAFATFTPDHALAGVRGLTGGRGASAVICGPGTPKALEHAVDAVAPNGNVVMFTPIEPGERFSFDQSKAYFRDINLIASYSCGPDDTIEALELIGRGVVTAEKLHARTYAFPDAQGAYEEMARAGIVKAIVAFE
jgi:L-iditol 2-dehydrogenase